MNQQKDGQEDWKRQDSQEVFGMKSGRGRFDLQV